MSASDNLPWMPVFVVRRSPRTHFAAHPGQKGPASGGPPQTPPVDDQFVRVGTAIRQSDGSYLVQLWALPTDGTLLMKAPGPGDQMGSMHSGGQ